MLIITKLTLVLHVRQDLGFFVDWLRHVLLMLRLHSFLVERSKKTRGERKKNPLCWR